MHMVGLIWSSCIILYGKQVLLSSISTDRVIREIYYWGSLQRSSGWYQMSFVSQARQNESMLACLLCVA